MKLLQNEEVQQVSGGDFTMVINGKCDSSMAYWMTSFFTQLVLGEISDGESLQQFINYAQTNGADWNEVRITDLGYSHFN
ncbi:MAG: hypothetical protein JSS07_00095 [Proteobacteria bacterium]|nr:hypothetical protein [Pseudomonadota bacterium]